MHDRLSDPPRVTSPILENSRHLATPLLVCPQNESLRSERRNSILMTRHFPDLNSASEGKFASTNQKHYPDLGNDARPFSIMLVNLAFNASRNSRIKPKKC